MGHAAQGHSPNAPIASSRSASCTQCSSTHVSCHGPHSPLARKRSSFDQLTFSTIRTITSARPSAHRSSAVAAAAAVRLKNGSKNARGLCPYDDGGTYFLSSTSCSSALSSTVSRSGAAPERDRARRRAVRRTRRTMERMMIGSACVDVLSDAMRCDECDAADRGAGRAKGRRSWTLFPP